MITCIFEDGGKGNLRHAITDSLLIKDNKILLVKRAPKLLEGGKWGIIGGYADRDENLLQTINREVFEETGYRLKRANFFTIIDTPNRRNDTRQNVAFVYICEPAEKEGEPDTESTEQKWFDLNNLPKDEEMAFDHLQIINLYLNNKDNTFPELVKY